MRPSFLSFFVISATGALFATATSNLNALKSAMFNSVIMTALSNVTTNCIILIHIPLLISILLPNFRVLYLVTIPVLNFSSI